MSLWLLPTGPQGCLWVADKPIRNMNIDMKVSVLVGGKQEEGLD